VSMPMVSRGYGFKNPKDMPCDVRVQINVSKPYRYGFAGMMKTNAQNSSNILTGNATFSVGANRLFALTSYTQLPTNIKASPANNNFPMYSFNTSDLAAAYNDNDVAVNALDLIRVVPNPYYGSSSYETGRADAKVRITNLPNKCTIKIFSLNGTLVRTFKRDVADQETTYTKPAFGEVAASVAVTGDDINKSKRVPYIEWDIKNQNNIAVASGLYIFHVDVPGVGEKIIKWFGVLRPLDLQNY